MKYPDRIDARWIGSLTDAQLEVAESSLRKRFAKQETIERKLRGERYDLMRGPEELTSAWMRWSMVSNAARARGVRLRYRV